MGALEAPQDKHGQEHRTGTSRAEQTTEAMAELGALEAMAELGAQEAMAGGHSWPWPRPSARPLQPEPFYPPKKISLGKLGGIRSPPGLDTQNSTRQDRNALQGQTDRTGQPTGTGSPRASSEAEASSGHDQESGALTGSLSDRLHFSDKGAGG